MQRSIVAAKSVERGAELRLEREQRGLRLLLGGVGGLGCEVELGAVAGRQADSLTVVAGKRARQFHRMLRIERCAFAQLDRSLVVRDANEHDAHVAK